MTDSAWVHIMIQNYPDNVITPECVVPREPTQWSIGAPQILGDGNVSTYQTPYVGDLDGDGQPEIVVAGKFTLDYTANEGWAYSAPNIYVFSRNTATGVWSYTKFNLPSDSTGSNKIATNGRGEIGLARANGSSPGLIVVATMDGYLRAYNKAGILQWKSNAKYSTATPYASTSGFVSTSIMFADFNGDGNAEILAGDRIFDLATGKLLLNLGFKNGVIQSSTTSVIATDVDKDGKPEVVWGGTVYKINITSNAGEAGNTFSSSQPLATLPVANTSITATIPIDIDLDGNVDILAYYGARFYIYDPVSGVLKVDYTVPAADVGANCPFVGDIDGDKYPEIVVGESATGLNLVAYDIDASGLASTTATVKWRLTTTDGSRGTGLTLFDFDQDEKYEIIYRDEDTIRVFDGASQATVNTPLFKYGTVGSGTLGEYPITADIDNDGEAEIIVTGNTTSKASTGNVYIFKSGSGSFWAPARPVWNQYMYNVVNINKDLTVPRSMFDISTYMSGPDGILGNSNDIQPFNGFLKQATIIDPSGVPAAFAIDVTITPNTVSSNYYADGDSIVITLNVENIGEVAIHSPWYISVYKNSVIAGAGISLDSVMSALNPGSNINTKAVIRNVSSRLPFDTLIIRINDRGQFHIIQTECDTTNNAEKIKPILAFDDHASTFKNNPRIIAPWLNDSIPSGTPPVMSIVTPPANGVTLIQGLNGDTILYTPSLDFVGYDSLVYRLTQYGNTATAKIYIYVAEKPDNILDADCYITPPGQNWSIARTAYTSEPVNYYSQPLCGDIDNDGKIEIIVGANTTTISIFEVDPETRAISLQQNLTVPTTIEMNFNNSYTIGKVDGNDYAAIFYTTAYNTASMSDNYTLIKYVYDGMSYSEAWRRQYTANQNYAGGTPLLADFSGTGRVQVQVYDKIWDARSGTLLVDGGMIPAAGTTSAYHFGKLPHMCHSTGIGYPIPQSYCMVADIDNDGDLEIIGGDCVYDVTIADPDNASASNTFTLRTKATGTYVNDGATAIADMDGDGFLDVVLTRNSANFDVRPPSYSSTDYGILLIYNPRTGALMSNVITNIPVQYYNAINPSAAGIYGPSAPFVGNINSEDKQPDIALTGYKVTRTYTYNPATQTLAQHTSLVTNDTSASTTMSLFDFTQTGEARLVYRDENTLWILKGLSLATEQSFSNVLSSTQNEYPIVADVDLDGHAEIIVTGSHVLNIYSSNPAGQWAPARSVWDRFGYNPVYINNDLTFPRYPINPASRLTGDNGILGDSDDVWPFNNFLQQQTELSTKGTPLWITPDVVFQSVNAERTGDSIRVTVCFENLGDAVLGSPTYITYYRDSISAASQHKVDSVIGHIEPGEDTCKVTVLSALPAFTQIVTRLNDKGFTGGLSTYPVQTECHYNDSTENKINPTLSLYMKKRATLNSVQNNGTYPNPVAVLYRDSIKYEITAVNANIHSGTTLIVRDTLPAYLDTVSRATWSSPLPVVTIMPGTPARKALEWTFPNLAVGESRTVSFYATPEPGSVASQPLFVNWANVLASDTLMIRGDTATYHQGAGVAVVTFAAAAGGSIFNFEPQAVDYSTAASSASILVVPDNGYVFSGWSHPAYISLRGIEIPADSGIMSLDTLPVYGNVEMTATFSLESTVESATTGIEPQALPAVEPCIWSAGSEIFVRPATLPAVLRIYTPEGVLTMQQTILNTGITKLHLPAGIYVATLNNSTGTKIVVSE